MLNFLPCQFVIQLSFAASVQILCKLLIYLPTLYDPASGTASMCSVCLFIELVLL